MGGAGEAPVTPAITERERMVRGEPYDTRDPELLALAHRARALVGEFATTPSTDAAARHAVLARLLGSVGEGVWIEPPFFCDYGVNLHIGPTSFVNANCVFLDSAEIRIGANALIAPAVQLLTATHPLRAAERIVPEADRSPGRSPYRTHARPIRIGDDVWIGAGSLVTADIPSHSLAFGQPCRVQRGL